MVGYIGNILESSGPNGLPKFQNRFFLSGSKQVYCRHSVCPDASLLQTETDVAACLPSKYLPVALYRMAWGHSFTYFGFTGKGPSAQMEGIYHKLNLIPSL